MADASCVFVTIPDVSITDVAPSLYAAISPGVPRSTPPKYLTTTIITFVSPADIIAPRMGLPAVPDGSPLSLDFEVLLSVPIT